MFCTKCGKEINKGTRYCVNCGNMVKIDSETIIKDEGVQKSASYLFRLLLIVIFSLIAISILFAMFASSGVGYINQPSEVSELKAFSGLQLGMERVDVTLLEGTPESEEIYNSRIIMVFDVVYGEATKVVYLDSDNRVNRICSLDNDSWDKVFGLGKGDSYSEILAKLGEPPEKSIDSEGLRMAITYPKYNVAFVLSEGKVDATCVTSEDKISFTEEYQQ